MVVSLDSKNIAGGVAGVIFKLSLTLILIFLVYNMAIKAFEFGYHIFYEEPIDPQPGRVVSITIIEGKSAMEIGEILEAAGLVHDAKLFYFQEMFSAYKDELSPGVYELSTAMTPQEMMGILAASYESEE